ncbi:MAG: RNA polymerase sigma factor, partial [Thermoleophilaceae bacterium]
YERYVPGVLSFCRHMLGSIEEAEDAVQHTFAAAHGGLLRDEREIDFKPWLYAIARNRSLSVLRARRESVDSEAEVSTAGLDDDVRRRADLRALVADLQDLPPDQREALVLTELEDLSHAEVSEVLGCPVASVKGLVFRARSGLMERRDARAAPCEEIQAELATARKGSLRKGKLRHHLKECVGCSAYLEDVRRQRRMLALLLPVVPSFGLKRSVLAACGLGSAGGAGTAGLGLISGGAPLAMGAVAKVAVAGALAGGAALGGGVAVKELARDSDAPAPAARVEPERQAPANPRAGAGEAKRGNGATPAARRAAGASGRSGARGARGSAASSSPRVPGKGTIRRSPKPSGIRAPGPNRPTPATGRTQRPSVGPDQGVGAKRPVAPDRSQPVKPRGGSVVAPKAKPEKAPPGGR